MLYMLYFVALFNIRCRSFWNSGYWLAARMIAAKSRIRAAMRIRFVPNMAGAAANRAARTKTKKEPEGDIISNPRPSRIAANQLSAEAELFLNIIIPIYDCYSNYIQSI